MFDFISDFDQRTLIDRGGLVRALELQKVVYINARFGQVCLFRRANNDALGVNLLDNTVAFRGHGCARVNGHNALHAGPDQRRFSLQQRHSLTHHVRSHQSTVRIVIFQKRDERGSNRNELFWRDVDEVNLIARDRRDFAIDATDHKIFDQIAIFVHFGISLRDCVASLFHGGEIFDFVLQLAVFDLAIRAFDEAVFVHARMGGERVDQANVRTFRRFNRANPTIVRWVDIADFKACAFARQATRAERGETTLMRDLGQRVGLVHEL